MRLLVRLSRVERLHPRGPVTAGCFLHRLVAHSRELGVIDLRLLLFADDMPAGSGVRLTGFLHPRTDDFLEVFLIRHHDLLRSRRERSSPATSPRPRRSVMPTIGPIREYAPLCLGEGPCWGKAIEVGRGSAPR